MDMVRFNIRIPKELMQQIQVLAKVDRRSVNFIVGEALASLWHQRGVTSLPPSSSLPSPMVPSPASIANTITPPPSLSPSILSLTPTRLDAREFELFWDLYPRKIGKGAARKAWIKALTKTDPATVLSAVKSQPWPADVQFLPHPATWLNQERWTDEPLDNSLEARMARVIQKSEDDFEGWTA